MVRGLHVVSERVWENLGVLFGGVAVATIGHQVLHEWRTPGPSSVSSWFVWGFLGIYLFWFLYGVRFRRRGIWLPNAMAVVLYALFAAVLLTKMGTGEGMKIKLTSVMVNDQAKALAFYTDILGFRKKTDVPVSGEFRWLTVVSSAGPEDVELVLEPNANPASQVYQKALFDQGIPATAFAVDDIQAQYERLKHHGVVFRSAPTKAGPVTIAVFEDTCGNLIQIYQA